MYKFDLQTFGQILPETRQRVYDEELSYIAEGINRPNFKEFVLKSVDGQLVYFHEGQWRPYISTLINGLETAKSEAARDYRGCFEIGRRVEDLERGYQIQSLKPGEKVVWHYDFPDEQLTLYGERFLGEMGFQPQRRMGYLCEAEKTDSGEVVIRHQSVDNSDKEAFAAALSAGRFNGSIDDMRIAYDAVMQEKHGREYFAGRLMSDNSPEEDSWSIIEGNRDLIEDYFMRQIEILAHQSIVVSELERAKKRLTYGVWAAIKERLENEVFVSRTTFGADTGILQQEVQSAYSALSARGEVLFGCGGAISAEDAILNASTKDVFESIFGKKMSCPFCGATQYGDPCSPNQFCSECKAKVVNGRIKSKGNGGKKAKNNKKSPDFFQAISTELARYEQERKQKAKLKKTA
ncbi:MAG: hypothetical protein WEC17_02350 [Candidatus Saccharimonadales bacterium]